MFVNLGPSDKQVDYARKLLKACGLEDDSDYDNIEEWTDSDFDALIRELKAELGRD